MINETSRAEEIFRRKFETFRNLTEQLGEEKAWAEMLEGYPERQKKQMGSFIDNATLMDGFTRAIPVFKQLNMEMEVIDISNGAIDAALEVQKCCPVLQLCKEYGFDTPCHVICEMDIEATKKAFPGMKAEILSRQADGACVCLFKYERPAHS